MLAAMEFSSFTIFSNTAGIRGQLQVLQAKRTKEAVSP